MALRSALQRYKTIARPKVGGGQSTYFSSLAKKTIAAEDDVMDHNYEIGVISAQQYLNELEQRLGRDTITPLQRVNLQQKTEKVQEDYVDSQYQNAYKAGDVSDRQMYQHEADKLSRMTAADGQAYQSQSAKVQGLKDKAEKAERKSYRVEQMNRISEMPEDTSQRLTEKANIFGNLAQQARADGDEEEATALETTYNNYVIASKKANIGDYISQTNQQLAASGGNIPYNEEESVSLDPISRAKESYQRALIYGQNVDKDIQSTQSRIVALKQAQNEYKKIGAIDSADALETQILNLQNRLADLKDSKAGNSGNLKEIQARMQEAQQGAAYKGAFGSLQDGENEILDAEQNLDLMLQEGMITKQQYLESRREVIQQKANLYTEFANLYSQYDKTNPASDMYRKAQREELKNLRDISTKMANPSKYELVENDEGVVELKDVYSSRVAKTFDQDYVQDGDIFRRVWTPGSVDADGNPRKFSADIKAGLSLLSDDPAQMPFVVKRDSKTGEMLRVPVVILDGKPQMKKGLPIGEEERIVRQKDGTYKTMTDSPLSIPNLSKAVAEPLGKGTEGFMTSRGIDLGKYQQGAKSSIDKLMGNLRSVQVPGVEKKVDITKSPFETLGVTGVLKDVFGKAAGASANLISKLFPKAEAAGPLPGELGGPTKITSGPLIEKKVALEGSFVEGTPDKYKSLISEASRATGIPTNVLSALIKSESNFNPNAKSPVGAMGIAQFMPETAKGMGINPLDPAQAIAGAAKYLKQQFDKFGSMDLALAAYNAGPGAVSKYGGIPPYAETQNYVRKIMGMSKYDNTKALAPAQETDARMVTPLVENEPWYSKLLNVIPKAKAAEPTGAKSVAPVKPGLLPLDLSSPSPVATPKVVAPQKAMPPQAMQLPQASMSSASMQSPSSLPKMPSLPSFSMPKLPTYNPIQTFQSNVGKIANVAQQAPKAVQNIASTIGQKATQAVTTVKNFLSGLFKK